MALTLIRMRLTAFRHALRRDSSGWMAIGMILGVILAAGTVAVAVLWPPLLPAALSGWLLGWVFGPIFLGGGDEALRPEYFTMIPVSPRRLAAGLLVGAFAGPAPLISLLAFSSLAVYGERFGLMGLISGLVMAVVTLIAIILISRVVVAAFGLVLRSRITAIFAALVSGTFLALTANGWALVVAFAKAGDLSWADNVTRILPSGWGIVAIESSPLAALGILTGCAVLIAALLTVWAALLHRRVTSAYRGGVPARRSRPRRFPAVRGPLAVTAKELRTWWRDLTRVHLLSFGFAYGLVFTLLPVAIGWWGMVPFAGLIAIVMAAGVTANLYGADGTALWLTLLTQGGERADVRGRQLAWLVMVGPLALFITVAGTLAGGEHWAWPWVLALLPALLGGAAGLVILIAVTALIPATDPHKRGGNPLSTGADEAAQNGLTWLMLIAVPVTALPAAAAVLIQPWLGVPVGVLTGTLLAWGLGRRAHRRLAATGPELLTLMKHGRVPAGRPETKATQFPEGTPLRVKALVVVGHIIAPILLFPQGIVAALFKIFEAEGRSWFLALYLPGPWQWPMIYLMAAAGLILYGFAILLPMRYRRINAPSKLNRDNPDLIEFSRG